MSYSPIKNPFEKLSVENQKETKEILEKQLEYFTSDKNTIVLGLNKIENKLTELNKKIDKLVDTLKAGKSGIFDKKDSKEIGKTAVAMGKGMEVIVGAIESYDKISDDAVDRFISGITKISEAFKNMSPLFDIVTNAGKTLMQMSAGILLFGLSLLVAGPLYLVAIPIGSFAITSILGILWAYTKIIGAKSNMKGISEASEALSYMALGIITFGLALIASEYIYKHISTETLLIVGGVMLGAILLTSLFSKMYDRVGKEATEAMMLLSASIVVFGLALIAAGLIYEYLWSNDEGGLLLIGATLLAVAGFFMLFSFAGRAIEDGGETLMYTALSLIVFAGAIWLWNKLLPPSLMNVGTILTMGLLLGTVAGVMILMGKASKDILKGALSMLIMSGTLFLFAFALKKMNDVFQDGFGWSESGLLLGTLGALGLEFGIAGTFVGPIALGALAFASIGGSILLMGESLKRWKEVKFSKEDALDLNKALIMVPMAFLGILGNEGSTWSKIKDVAKQTAIVAAASANALMFISISASLYSIGKGLNKFKQVKYSEKDADNLKYVITSVARAFANIDNDQKDFSWKQVRKGINSMSKIGRTLTSLAKGIKSLANMTVSEWEYDEKTGKMVEKDRVQLGEKDYKLVGDNIGMIISSLAEPLSEVGKADAGGSARSKFASIFGKGHISRGVDSLKNIGDTLVGLAEGVQSFANLTIPIYKVEDGKLVLDGYRRMGKNDFTEAGENIGEILTTLADPLAQIGKINETGSADGNSASGSLLSKVFGGNYIKKGVEALSGIGNIVLDLAKAIPQYAKLEFTKYKVDSNGQLIEDGTIKISNTDITKAQENISSILTASANSILNWYNEFGSSKKERKNLKKAFELASELSSNIAVVANDTLALGNAFKEIGGADKFGNEVGVFMSSFARPFDPKLTPNVNTINRNFGKFASDISILGKNASELKSIDKSFKGIAKSMGTFKDNLNNLDPTILKETRGLFDAMAIIAKENSSGNILQRYGDILEETFNNLAELLSKFGQNVSDNTQQISQNIQLQTDSQSGIFNELRNQKESTIKQPSLDSAQQQQVVQKLQQIANILSGTIKVRDTSKIGI